VVRQQQGWQYYTTYESAQGAALTGCGNPLAETTYLSQLDSSPKKILHSTIPYEFPGPMATHLAWSLDLGHVVSGLAHEQPLHAGFQVLSLQGHSSI
jgi:hypothetical protein